MNKDYYEYDYEDKFQIAYCSGCGRSYPIRSISYDYSDYESYSDLLKYNFVKSKSDKKFCSDSCKREWKLKSLLDL